MADKKIEKKSEQPASPGVVDESEMRNVLAKRLAVAGALVAVLLGLLGLFDHLSQPTEEDDLPVFTRPVPVVPKKMVTQPVTPAEPVADDPAPAVTAQADAKTPAVSPSASTAYDTPPAPVVAATPAAASGTLAPTMATTEIAPKKASTVKTPARVSSSEPAAVPEKTTAPDSVAYTEPPPPASASPRPRPTAAPAPAAPPLAVDISESAATKSAPSARVIEAVPAPAAARVFSGFILQAGVFSSAARAEELHARLTLSGIPSSIEARVQVGPFKSRQEALAAQEKMRELGVESLLVPPKGGR